MNRQPHPDFLFGLSGERRRVRSALIDAVLKIYTRDAKVGKRATPSAQLVEQFPGNSPRIFARILVHLEHVGEIKLIGVPGYSGFGQIEIVRTGHRTAWKHPTHKIGCSDHSTEIKLRLDIPAAPADGDARFQAMLAAAGGFEDHPRAKPRRVAYFVPHNYSAAMTLGGVSTQ